MYKTSVYTLVNGNIEGLAHRKQQNPPIDAKISQISLTQAEL